jgi:8-oxo-dGTP pyrophosphatase MutT (NUDIX family)
MMDDWLLLGSRSLADHRIFEVWADRYRLEPEGRERDFVRLVAPDWINVIPITPDEHVVFVRQYRHGVRALTLEVPGGMVDAGESPPEAALRELREESGYTAPAVESLGAVWPNPAIQDNRCHMFVARGAVRDGDPNPDLYERFEVVTRPLAQVPQLIRDGEIRHALVVTAFALLGVTRG